MQSLFFRFVILLLATVFWIALLAFGIRPDYAQWSNLKLVSLHFMPPLALCLSWWLGRWYLNRRHGNATEVPPEHPQVAAQPASDAMTARLEQRRQYCDCRLLAISDLAVHEALQLQETLGVSIATVKADEKSQALAPGMPGVCDSGIAEALAYIYAECGAAASLPIYLAPPAESTAGDVAEHVRKIAAKLIFDMRLTTDAPPVMSMPPRGSASNCVLGLFETVPDLAAAVVLAFDSPMARPPQSAVKPGHGVFALLLTAADLPATLEAMAKEEAQSIDHLHSRIRGEAGLASVPKPLRDELAALDPVARIHRAAAGKFDEKPGRAQAFEHALTDLLDQAQKHVEASSAPAGDVRCGWLVHNTGESKQVGGRLASIAGALMQRKIELKPIDMATDMLRHLGDLGQASPIGMLALSLLQAQVKQAPVLCAEFAEPDGVSLAFTAPVPKT